MTSLLLLAKRLLFTGRSLPYRSSFSNGLIRQSLRRVALPTISSIHCEKSEKPRYLHNYRRREYSIGGAIVNEGMIIAKERAKRESIKLLLSKPSHETQMRKTEIDEIEEIFEKIRSNSVVSVILLGAPACGKTQLARQYGSVYYSLQKQNQSKFPMIDKKIVIVGTLDVRNESSLWRSYSRLAEELNYNVRAEGQLKDRLAILKAKVQRKFRENPGWLLIVDGVNEEMAREFEDYWPQPNSEGWGEGRVLVATSSKEVAKKYESSPFSQEYECPKMQVDDAVNLLQKMSDVYEKGAKAVVTTPYINNNPFDIACAAIIIKEERSKNEKYGFSNFIQSREKGETKLTVPSSLPEAVKRLATDEDLKLVFTAMGMCAHDPIPYSVMDRLLGKDIATLKSIKECPLLLKIPEQNPPVDVYDKIPRIYAHFSTVNQFREELISKSKKDKGLQDLQRQLVKSVLDEYDKVSISETEMSKWIPQLLFRHLQHLLHYEEDKTHYLDQDLKIRLAATLSNAHIELNQNPEKSKSILTKELEKNNLSPYSKAKLDLSWAKVYRHLCEYESSACRLSDALKGIDHIRDQLSASDATECLKECTALSLHYHSSGYDESENLKKSMNIYQEHMGNEPSSHVLGEAKCALSHLYLKIGKWSRGQEYLNEAEHLLDGKLQNFSERESLAVVYSEIGNHKKSIEILKELIEQMQESYDLENAPSSLLSIPYARLCSAYYYNGQRNEAYKLIEKCIQCLDHDLLKSNPRDTRLLELSDVVMRRTPYFPPWTAMHIITTLLCDFGDITYPMSTLIEKIENSKFEDTPLLLGRLYRHRGYYPNAQKILEEHLRENDGYRKSTIRIGLIWAELGKVYREQGYIINGLRAFEKAYNIYRQFYVNLDHPEVAFMQAELGRVIQLNGNKQLGMEMMKNAVELCKRHMEDEACRSKNTYVAIKYAQMLSAFGIVLRYEYPPDRMDEVLQYLYEALVLQDSTLDQKSINRVRTLYYIGCALQKKGDLEKAREKMMESLKLIRDSNYHHPYEASICTGLGRLLQKSDPEEAEKYMKDAFVIRKLPEKFSSDAHWKVAFAYQNVGEIMRDKGSKLDAFDYFLDANDMFMRLIERESLECEDWLDSRSSSAPDYGIDIIGRWKKDKEKLRNEMRRLVSKQSKE